MKKLQRLLGPVIALVFVLAATPVRADDEGRKCTACAECHPDSFWCLQCAERVIRANGNCCGSGDGTAYCHADSGFSVTCEGTGRTCECDSEGRDCEVGLIYE